MQAGRGAAEGPPDYAVDGQGRERARIEA